ncbi:MAG: thioredoxin-disulfide reductase [Clostridia bacterium]
MHSIIIIGGGPSGLSAAIYARRAGADVLVLESSMCGGQMINTPEIENYPAIEKISGFELATNMYNHALTLGTKFKFESVASIKRLGENFVVITAENSYDARSIIIANGAKRKKLGVKGEDEFAGHGVSYCATCDGSFFRKKIVAVNGGGNTALEDALYLSKICEKVILIHRRDEFRAHTVLVDELKAAANIELVLNSTILEIKGESKVSSIIVKNNITGDTRIIEISALFVAIGLAPDNSIFSNIVELDKNGYIIAGEDCKTTTDKIYAVGDTRTKQLRQIITAASDGAIAAISAAKI